MFDRKLEGKRLAISFIVIILKNIRENEASISNESLFVEVTKYQNFNVINLKVLIKKPHYKPTWNPHGPWHYVPH